MTISKDSGLKIDNSQVKRIFIARPDNLGDVILFSGVLRQIKERYPEARIVLCVKNYVRNLLEHCPHVDEVIAWEPLMFPLSPQTVQKKGGWRLERLLRKLRLTWLSKVTYKTDLFLLPVRSATPEMHQFASFFRAPLKFGILDGTADPQAPGAIYTDVLTVPKERAFEHEINIHADFLSLIGCDADRKAIHPEIHTTKADAAWAEENISKQSGTVLLGICPGVTSRADKFYAASNYARAVSALEHVTFSVVLFGSKSEREQCRKTADALGKCKNIVSIKNVAGQSSLRQLAEGFKLCDIVLSNETGALHLATALKKPTVGIVGGGHFGRFYPWGDPALNLTANQPLDCYYCNWECIYPTIRCIHEIKPEIITDKLSQLLPPELKESAKSE